MSIKKGMAKKFFATAAAGAVALMGLAGVANAAPGAGAPGANDPDATGSLTISKCVGDKVGEHNGTALESFDCEIPAGVQFTVTELVAPDGLTPADSAWWDAVEKAAPGAPTGWTESTTNVQIKTTIEGEKLVFSGLPMGLYKVSETGVPAGLIAGADFFVSIPFPSDGDNGWIWDVNVYPKNSKDEGTEKIPGTPEGDGKYTAGAIIPWTIKGATYGTVMSWLNDGEELKNYWIGDKLPPELTLFGDITVTMAPSTTALTEGTDYKVVKNEEFNTFQVVLTEVGINKLKAEGTDEARVVLDFKTKLDENWTPTGVNGELENGGYTSPTLPGDEGWDGEPEEGGEEIVKGKNYYGEVEITKVDSADSTPLKGAEFQVVEGKCSEASAPLSYVTDVNGAPIKGTTDATGKVTMPPLFVGSTSSADEQPPTGKDYCLVETKAPAGYVLPAWDANGKDVTIVPGKTTAASNSVEIENTKTSGPTLPLTGAAGTALLIVGGLALIGLAGSIVVTSRRRSAENA